MDKTATALLLGLSALFVVVLVQLPAAHAFFRPAGALPRRRPLGLGQQQQQVSGREGSIDRQDPAPFNRHPLIPIDFITNSDGQPLGGQRQGAAAPRLAALRPPRRRHRPRRRRQGQQAAAKRGDHRLPPAQGAEGAAAGGHHHGHGLGLPRGGAAERPVGAGRDGPPPLLPRLPRPLPPPAAHWCVCCGNRLRFGSIDRSVSSN